MKTKETVCQEADRIVSTDRQHDYGHPADDFERTALMWTGLFRDLLKPGVRIEAQHVPLAMVLVKCSREMNHPKRDSLVDICGYAKTAELVYDRKRELARRRKR